MFIEHTSRPQIARSLLVGRCIYWAGILTLCMVQAPLLFAQLEVPVTIVLDGVQSTDRQITGTGTPVELDAAMSLRALRATTASFTMVQGTNELTGDLTPSHSGYSPGMMVTIVPTSTNTGPITLDLNGAGPQAVVKHGNLAVDSAEFHVGIPVRLVYNGARFQLLNSTQLPCPVGFFAATREYCITDSSFQQTTFFQAIDACVGRGARLCTFGEWTNACRNFPGFLGTVMAPEWVDHAANNTDGAKLLGAGNDGVNEVPGTACEYGGQGPPNGLNRYRCCAHR